MRQASTFRGTDQLAALDDALRALRALAAVVNSSDEQHRRIYAPELAMAQARLAVLDAFDARPPQIDFTKYPDMNPRTPVSCTDSVE